MKETADLDKVYAEMAADEAREAEALAGIEVEPEDLAEFKED